MATSGSETPRCSLIVQAIGPERLVQRIARMAADIADGPGTVDIVVLHDGADASFAASRLARLGLTRSDQIVEVGASTQGEALNRAVRASTGTAFVLVDGSCAIDASYVEAALDALAGGAAFAGAAGGFIDVPHDGVSRQVEIGDLVSSAWSVAAPVIRRDSFDRAGGFNEALPGLVEWDLLLTLVEAGRGGLRLARQLARPGIDDVALHLALRDDRYLPAIRAVFARHTKSFEAHPARVLADRDRTASALWRRERDLVAKRDAVQARLDAAVAAVHAGRERLRALGRAGVEFGELARTSPLNRNWGLDRGRPVDRHYIEGFVATHASDIRGTVLELLDDTLTVRFGGRAVSRVDVLDIDPSNARATVVADLRSADSLDSNRYDCIVLTQTLHLIDDMAAALRHVHRVLKPGGVLLLTVPSVSMVAEEYGSEGDHWRLTPAGARGLVGSVFGQDAVRVAARGNVLAATASLYGLSCDDVDTALLDRDDPAYPVIVTVRAVKAAAPALSLSSPSTSSTILLYHRIATPTSDTHQLAVSPGNFQRQLEHLCTTCRIVSLAELVESRNQPDGRRVALTFDDGYLDNLEIALPLLERFSVPATFLVTTEGLNRPGPYWWDVLEHALLSAGDRPPSLTLVHAGTRLQWETSSPAARRGAHDAVYRLLKASAPAVRDDLLRQLRAFAGLESKAVDARPMSADEIRTLASSPAATIGGHTVHHVALPSAAGDDLHREVFECRTALERLLGTDVTTFAYPYGDLDAGSVAMVQRAGFRHAMTCESRRVTASDLPLRLPRAQAPDLGAEAFAAWLDQL